MRKLTLLLIAAALSGAGDAAGQGMNPSDAAATTMSPEEAVRLGLERNLRLRAAEADAAEARAVYRESRAARLPSISTQANYTRLSDNIPEAEFSFPGLDTTFTILPIERNRFHSEISLEQPLFTGFRVHNEIRAAARRADAAEELRVQEEVDVAYDIRRAYWQLFQSLAMTEALDASLALVDEHVRIVAVRVAEETALRRDLLSAQTRRSEVRLEQVEARNAVQLARLELNRLVGLALDAPTHPVEEIAMEPLPAAADSLIGAALASQPRLRALEDQEEALRLQTDATRGAWLPEVAAFGRYVYAKPNPYVFTEQGKFFGTGEVGLSLQWSLFDGGGRSARTRQSAARLESARAELAEAREQVVVGVMRQYLEAERATEALQVAAQHLEEAEETYRVARRQFEEDVALPGDVLEAEQTYREARARQAQARADYAIAQAGLLHILGRVW